MADSRQEQLNKIKEKYGVKDAPDDFNPHDYRGISHGTNYFDTLAHILKASLGTGILAMPEAFKHAGYINGIAFTLVIGIVCTYGIHLLIRSQYLLCKRLKVSYLTYPLAMKAALLSGPQLLGALGKAAQVMVDTFLIVYQTGTCCVYIIFVAANIQKLVNSLVSDTRSIEMYIVFLLPFFLFILAIPNLKWLAPFSFLSNVLTFVTMGILLYFIFVDLPDFSNVVAFGAFKDFPLFVGTALFAVAAVGVVTSVEKNMKTPSQFCSPFGVLNVSMTIIIVSYVALGFFGYWRWKDKTCPSVTLNLPKKSVAAKVIQGMYAFAIYVSYGLNGYVPIDIIWNTYVSESFKERKYSLVWEYMLRLALVIFTTLLSVTIPLLGLFISLFGALCMAALEIIFPALMDMCVKWPDQLGRGYWVVITDIAMILAGLYGLFSGTYVSIYGIVTALSQKHSGVKTNSTSTCVDT